MSDLVAELRRLAEWVEPDIDLAEAEILTQAADEIEQKNRLIELLTEQVRVSLDGLPIDAEKMLAWLENMSQNRSQPDSDDGKTGQTLPTGDSDG